MDNRVEIKIFRHGVTEWNLEGRIQGHLDVPLAPRGLEEARRLAPLLARWKIQAVLSSDLSRSRITAEIAASDGRIPVFSDPRFREMYLGAAQGLTHSEIEAKFGSEIGGRFRSNPLSDADVLQFGSETTAQVIERTLAGLSDFLRSHGFARVALSSHGGVIRRLIQHAEPLLAWSPPIPNCVIYPFEFGDGLRLCRWNDLK